MKNRLIEKLFEMCKGKMLDVVAAVQAGHPVDEETTHALVELWADFLLVANRQGEPLRFTLCDTAIVTLQAAVALRKVCRQLGMNEVPDGLAATYWAQLRPVLAPPGDN